MAVPEGTEVGSAPGADLAISADGSTLAVVRDPQVALLDPERLTVEAVIEENEGIGGLMLSPTGGMLAYQVDNALVVRSLAEPDAAGLRLSGPEAGSTGSASAPTGNALQQGG